MRKIGVILLFFVGSMFTVRAAVDSLALAETFRMLDNYVAAIEAEDCDAKSAECDFLISTCTDSILRQGVAQRLYDHYCGSSLMGDEAVAIHIFDKWFAGGAVKMSSEDDFFAAKLFADFNRNSLIGLKAPVLELRDAEGVSVSVPGHSERRKVLYFYDVDCSKCQVESILLANTLDHMDREVDLYAVYVGDDEDRWREYSSQRFHITSEKVNVFNLWDPDGESGMQLQYGVVQTPRLLLVDARGVIEGRRLTVEALKQLLLMDEIDDILISRNKTGDHLPEIELEGRVENNGRSREKTLRLDKFKGNPAYVIFYSESCHRCKEELDALKSHPIPGARFLFVDVDRIVADDPDLGRRLFDSFDLTLLPHIIKVDRKGVITDKYVSFKK